MPTHMNTGLFSAEIILSKKENEFDYNDFPCWQPKNLNLMGYSLYSLSPLRYNCL